MRIYAWSAFFIILYESTIWVNEFSWNVNRKQFSRINYVICEIIVPNYETDTDRHPFRDWTLLRHHWNHNSISLSSRIDKPTVMILSLRHCRKGWWRIWWLARNIQMNSRLPPYGRLNIFLNSINSMHSEENSSSSLENSSSFQAVEPILKYL